MSADEQPSTGKLQPGIAFAEGKRPAACFRLLLLDFADQITPAQARDALAAVMEMLEGLGRGQVRELTDQPPAGAANSAQQFRSLQTLLAYGRPAFSEQGPLPHVTRPHGLSSLSHPSPAFPALPWHASATTNTGEAAIALQLTADNAAAVNCAAIEVWKLIIDRALPLTVAGSFDGFGRPDGRGWLEFHDGVSNLEAGQRPAAIVAGPDPAWMDGGTYLAFLRIRIDLSRWSTMSRVEQKLTIGRDKLTGAGLTDVVTDQSGQEQPRMGDPAPEPDSPRWRDPAQTLDPHLEVSHIHRANQTRASGWAPGALRIFRQGFDYLEHFTAEGPELGLNFISFQRDLGVLHDLLHLPGWLGDSNFGGTSDSDPTDRPLLTLAAGGLYAVPPTERPFPTAGLFRP